MNTIRYLFTFIFVLAFTAIFLATDKGARAQVTQEGDFLCFLVTFEGGGQLTQIRPDTGGLVPGTPIRFPLTELWVTALPGIIPFSNNPSGATIATWLNGTTEGEVTFEQPVSAVSLYFASQTDFTLDALDADGTGIDSDGNLANAEDGVFDQWDMVSVDVGVNEITKVRLSNIGGLSLIDDFEACLFGRQVSVDVRPGSDQNIISLSSSGLIAVAILSTDDFDAPTSIDPDSLRLAGARVMVVGKSNMDLCQGRDVNGDSIDDLVCQFENLLDAEPGDSTVVLEGETFDGVPIHGEDSISIVND